MRTLLGLLAVLALAGAASAQQNVLIIVADDMGVDLFGAYGEHPDAGHTPVLDQLANEGVLFRNCWANPVCTTSRATILSGRYALRTGVGGGPPTYVDPPWLKNEETTLAEVFAPTHATWALGKWHLDNETEPFVNPLQQGFDLHRGTPGSMDQLGGETYFDWIKSVDGVFENTTTYATTDTVDDALELIQNATGPWFLYLAMNAPHGPLHKPPSELHTFDLPPSVNGNIPIHVKAMVEAMDTELGRLFDGMGPTPLADTLVIFLGDNGTTKAATTLPFIAEHAKGTIYEGGINVPLVIAGPGVVQGAVCNALVNTTDIFATAADFVGAAHPTAIDSVSMLPYFAQPALPSIRPWVYSEYFAPDSIELHPLWDRVLRDERYKLVQHFKQDILPFKPRTVEFYDLLLDPFEQVDLMLTPPLSAPQKVSYDALSAVAEQILGPWLNFGQGLAGASGKPFLVGSGPFTENEAFTVTLSKAQPLAPAALILGFDTFDLPFKGGVMVPDFTSPGGVYVLGTDATGGLELVGALPPGAPPGVHLYLQYWIQDVGGPVGWAASNAIAGTIQ